MAKTCDKVIIVLGSCQESGTEKNPFTPEERKDMIQHALQDEDIIPKFDVEMREVDDMEDDKAWTEKVIEECGDIDLVWTGDEWTKKCFEDKGIQVKDIVEVPGISATEVRKRIKESDETWKELVPEEVARYLVQINGTEKVRSID